MAQEARPAEKMSVHELYTQNPFVVYRAQGEANACGPGCDEWIAVEGSFTPGAAARFSKLIRSLKGRAGAIPVFFASPGGVQSEAIAIGRLLRQHRMTAGVAKTLPAACPAGNPDAACKAAKASGATLKAEWRNINTQCNSSCVFALIGATTRLVPPTSYVAVHSSRSICFLGGKFTENVKGLCVNRSADARDARRRYIQEMGIGHGLFDVIEATPFESLHFLTRDELVRFGIDSRASQEVPWTLIKESSGAAYIIKPFTEAKGADGDDIRLSFVRLTCVQGRIAMTYGRGIPQSDMAAGTQVTMAIGKQGLVLSHNANPRQLPPGQSWVDIRGAVLPASFGAALNGNETIEIREARLLPGGIAQSHRLKIQTDRLPALWTMLQSHCSPSTST